MLSAGSTAAASATQRASIFRRAPPRGRGGFRSEPMPTQMKFYEIFELDSIHSLLTTAFKRGQGGPFDRGERLNARTLLASRQQCSSSLHRPVTRRPQAVFGCVLMGTSRIKQQEKSLRGSDECSKIIGSVCKDSRKTAWKIVEICWYFSDSVLILLNLFTELRDYQNMSFENARCHEAENIQLNAGEKGQSFRL